MLKLGPVLLLLASLPCFAQTALYAPVDSSVVAARLREVPRKNADREALIKKLFVDAGCAPDRLTEQKVSGEKLPNVVCVLPGQTEDEIIVGAHFDCSTEFGSGAIDNWTGASLLPSLLQALKTAPRQHTYVFVAFTAEEHGLIGSEFYAKHMSKEEKARLAAMVNLDSLGLSPTKVWVTQADPELVKALAYVSHTLNLPASELDVDRVGSSDSISFKKIKVPSITIHSVTPQTLKYLHSSNDQISAIHLNEYYDTYKLVSGYLAYLDLAVHSKTAAVATKPTKTGD